MGLTPHSKTVTFNNAVLRAETTQGVRSIEIYPNDEPHQILSRLGFGDGAYDLINPVTGLAYSPNALPFNTMTDGGSITVKVSKRNSPS